MRSWCGVTNYSGYWYFKTLGRWVHRDEIPKHIHVSGSIASHYGPVYTIKQFNKKLRVWRRYLPKGIEFILVSRYVDVADVYRKIR